MSTQISAMRSGQARDTLLLLANKESHKGARVLFDHEVRIFEHSLAVIKMDGRQIMLDVLQAAIKTCNYDIVRRIIEALGPDDLHDQPWVLSYAIKSSSGPPAINILELILQHGANVNAQDENGLPPLYFALERRNALAFGLLLDAGADVSQPAIYTVIEHFTFKYDSDFLQSHHHYEVYGDERSINESQTAESLFGLACRIRQLGPFRHERSLDDIVLRLIDQGHLPGAGHREKTVIYPLLCHLGQLDRLRALAISGVDVLSFDMSLTAAIEREVQTPEDQACQLSLIAFLLALGADGSVSVLDWKYYPSWIVGVQSQEYCRTRVTRVLQSTLPVEYRYAVCMLLLDAGVNSADQEQLLLFAIAQGWTDKVDSLLSRGIRLAEVPPSTSMTIIDMLVRHGSSLKAAEDPWSALPATGLGLLESLARQDTPLKSEQWGAAVRDFIDESVSRDLYPANPSSTRLAMLDRLIKLIGPIDTTFTVAVSETRYRGTRSLSSHRDQRFEETNLICLVYALHDPEALRWLLDQGANPTCPGLPVTALQFALAHPTLHMASEVHEALVAVLIECSSPRDIEDLLKGLGSEVDDIVIAIRASRSIGLSTSPAANDSLRTLAEDELRSRQAEHTSGDAKRFSYSKINAIAGIRLFHLQTTGSFNDTIVGSVTHHELSQAPTYNALSYVWGSTANLVPIQVDDCQLFITQSLHAALLCLRQNGIQSLWIDAVCINQTDNDEKSGQVSIMGEIFATADQTIIWLGRESECSQRLFAALRAFGAGPIGSFNLDGPFWSMYVKLIQHPWFFRTWILQELCLSKKAIIMCGLDYLDKQDFHMIGLKMLYTEKSELRHARTSSDLVSHACAIFRLTPHSSLADIMGISRRCEATDPRDKVFGILGLLKRPIMSIDYSMSIAEVYINFTAAAIHDQDDPVRYLELLHWQGTARSLPGLPSWVPNWSITDAIGVLPDAFNWLNSVRLEADIKKPRIHELELIVEGIHLDRIRALSEDIKTSYLGWYQIVMPVLRNDGLIALHRLSKTLHAISENYRSAWEHRAMWNFLVWYVCYSDGLLERDLPQLFQKVVLLIVMVAREHESLEVQRGIDTFKHKMEQTCYGRSFFLTSGGSMGLAPPQARIGDAIVLIPGSTYPFVLREREQSTWEMIGDCYLENLDAKKIMKEREATEFVIV